MRIFKLSFLTNYFDQAIVCMFYKMFYFVCAILFSFVIIISATYMLADTETPNLRQINENRLDKKESLSDHRVVENNYKYGYGSMHPVLWTCPIKKQLKDVFHRAQYKEDEWILLYYLKNNLSLFNGIFIEIGAYNGYEYSTTYLLEQTYGWRGLLIEGSSMYFRGLNNSGRERSYKINKVVCKSSNEVIYNELALGLSGLKKYSPESRKAYLKSLNSVEVNVTCHSMKEIISDYHLTHIDVFSLDVEGAEAELLDTFDWSVLVRLWLIETNYHLGIDQAIEDENVRKIMRSHGYILIYKPIPPGVNEVWLNPHYDELVKPLLEVEKKYYNDNGKDCE